MEQQTISVAKAGLVCKLNTRTTILAATNPKGAYDPEESISVNVALASPLLSRFDLVLVLLDTKNEDWDRIISSFILENKGNPRKSDKLWSMEKMKTYFCLIKNLQPKISEEANMILVRYYQLQRQSDSRNAARTTIRLLESLIRLAEAHARIMYRNTVTVEDAITVVSVMESSMQGGALLGGVNALHTAFPENPREQYQMQCELLLDRLGLHSILQVELQRLAWQQNQDSSQSGNNSFNISRCHVEEDDPVQPRSLQPGSLLGKVCSETASCSAIQTSTEITVGSDQKCSDVSDSLLKESHESSQQAGPSKKISNEQTLDLSANRTSTSSDLSLRWFDSISSEQQTLEMSPIPNATKGYTSIKDHSGMQPGLVEINDRDKDVVPEEAEGKTQPRKGSSPTRVNPLPNEVITEHVSKKWQKLNKKSLKNALSAKESMENNGLSETGNSISSGPLHSTPARGKKRNLGQVEPEERRSDTQDPEMLARLAQLAKFTFKQKTKLTLCPEIESIKVQTSNVDKENRSGGVDDQQKSKSTPAGKLQKLLRGSITTEQKDLVPILQKEAKDSSGAATIQERLQDTAHTMSSNPAHTMSSNPAHTMSSNPAHSGDINKSADASHCTKVASSTLAKLAKFSFTSTSENKTPEIAAAPCKDAPKSPGSQKSGGKRKCFQLDPPSSKTAVTCKSLFSTTDLDDETLEFDWNDDVKS